MKTIEPNEGKIYFLHNGRLVEFIGYTDQRVNIFKTVEEKDGEHCPHCEKFIEPKLFHEVESSRNFQNSVEPISTLTNL